MIDIKFLRENPDVVRENIKKKFQDEKLPLVDEVIALDKKIRACVGPYWVSDRFYLKPIGALFLTEFWAGSSHCPINISWSLACLDSRSFRVSSS